MNKRERNQSVLGQAKLQLIRVEFTNHFPRSDDSHGDCLFYAKYIYIYIYQSL